MSKTLWALPRVILLSAATVGIFNGYSHLKTSAKSAGTEGSVLRNIEYVSNTDGDTFLANIDNIPPLFGRHIPVRIAHIDTAEMRWNDECEKSSAVEAQKELLNILTKAKKIDLINVKRDKYFRILADVIVDDTLNVSSYILSKKLAVPYEGDAKVKVDWCSYPPNK